MKFEIRTYPRKCIGCLDCQLICSFSYEEIFNIFKARIIIDRLDGGSKISFTDKCNGCGLCADYCLSEALEKVEVGD